jgi:hypothetical protein
MFYQSYTQKNIFKNIWQYMYGQLLLELGITGFYMHLLNCTVYQF